MRKVQGSPQPLGVALEKDRINFAVSVPPDKSCELLLYHGDSQAPAKVFPMPLQKGAGEVRFLAVEDLKPSEYEYNYKVDGKVCIDPFAREISGHTVFGGAEDLDTHKVRGRFVTEPFDWEGDILPGLPCHEIIAYSLHVRGFTKHASSKVKHKGTFKGVEEKLPYLKELGINQIQCMPVYEFQERTSAGQNYWGYGPGCYFAPKAAYSVSGNPVRELKKLVRTCHKEGIEVVLEMPFQENMPVMTSVRCLRYYMLEYHVDGFIVNPCHVSFEELLGDPYLKGIKLIKKEEWFQNVMRRFLKGDEGMVEDVIWALRRNTQQDKCMNFITAHTGFTLFDLVSYDGKHNEDNGENNQDGPVYNYSWNCGAEGQSRKRSIVDLRKKQMRNAFYLLLTAKGTPCLLAGDEFENTQRGNNNVYCQDNELSWLNWNKLKNDNSLFRFVKALIALRKSCSLLHPANPLKTREQISWGVPDVSYHGENAWQMPTEVPSRQLGVFYSGKGEKEKDCYIAYNMHWESHSFALPSLPGKRKWHKAMDTGGPVPTSQGFLENQRMLVVEPRSIVLLFGK